MSDTVRDSIYWDVISSGQAARDPLSSIVSSPPEREREPTPTYPPLPIPRSPSLSELLSSEWNKNCIGGGSAIRYGSNYFHRETAERRSLLHAGSTPLPLGIVSRGIASTRLPSSRQTDCFVTRTRRPIGRDRWRGSVGRNEKSAGGREGERELMLEIIYQLVR